MNKARYIIGIDEVGRGPVAGPVAIGAVCVKDTFSIADALPDVADSKALSPKKREAIFNATMPLVKEGDVQYAVVYGSALRIDREGIEKVIASLVAKALHTISASPSEVQVFLDGRLKAPPAYFQETVIKGDSLIPAISLASILAKVSRDRRMVSLADTYPQYGFEAHKGYGTKRHLDALREYGVCPEHRTSFLTRVDGIIGL